LSERPDLAPEGTTWVCGACGKCARHRIDGGLSDGWDSSCTTWAVLCYDESIIVHDGVVRAARAVKSEP
jgi:hypothetical protein